MVRLSILRGFDDPGTICLNDSLLFVPKNADAFLSAVQNQEPHCYCAWDMVAYCNVSLLQTVCRIFTD